MKVCQIHGDMSADRMDDIYPTEVFCDECYNEMNVDNENNPIVTEETWNDSWGDTCSQCNKTLEEEKAENEV